jgi:hypothetical protein
LRWLASHWSRASTTRKYSDWRISNFNARGYNLLKEQDCGPVLRNSRRICWISGMISAYWSPVNLSGPHSACPRREAAKLDGFENCVLDWNA